MLLNANDFLDQKIIENGRFVPNFKSGSIIFAINEIVKMVRITLAHKKLKIKCDLKGVSHFDQEIRFDHRRLQQVLLNLLSNAIKFQSKGKIIVKAKL